MADSKPFIDRVREAMSTRDGRIALAIFAALGFYYAVLTPVEFTIGDAPELLLAGYTLGNPHPSGYPLFTILTFVFSHLPGPSPFWNASVALSGLTTAGSAVFLYLTLRKLRFGHIPAAAAAMAWGAANPIVYQATRVEVYGLHCLFFGAAIWAVTVLYTRARPAADEAAPQPIPQQTDDDRQATLRFWAATSVAFVCLGLTNHLTTVFLVVPVVISVGLADRKTLLNPKNLAIFSAIAVAGAALYAYLPLSAMANTGDRFSWNDPQTVDNFLRHVTGQEYAQHLDINNLGPSLLKFLDRFDRAFFPGIAVLSAIGLYEIAARRWRMFVSLALIAGPLLVYIGSYQINDIATYDPPIFWVFLLAAGAAADWLMRVRFADHGWQAVARKVAIVGVGVAIAVLLFRSRTNGYKELLGHDHSTYIVERIETPAIVFSDLDRHTFPMWYQTLVNHTGPEIVTFDSVMLTHPDMKWYRAWLQKRYPDFHFPTDEVVANNNWRDWMIANNPDYTPYAILHQPWRGRATHARLEGPYHTIHDGGRKPGESKVSRKTSMLFMATWKRAHGNTYWTNMQQTFRLGDPIACVTEWMDHDGLSPTWKLIGPDGAVVTYDEHPVPKGSNISWEYFEPEDQRIGDWRCEVGEANGKPISIEFQIID